MNVFKRNIRIPRVVYDHIPGFHIFGGIACLFSPSSLVVAIGITAIIHGSWIAFQRHSANTKLNSYS